MTDDLDSKLQRMRDGWRAEEELYELLREEMVERIRKELPGKVRARLDAEDVYDEAFLRALQGRNRFEWRGERSFGGYIFTIAQNYIRDVLRRKSADQVHFADATETGSGGMRQVPDRGPRSSETFRNQEAVDTHLAHLKPKEEEVMRLRIMEGLSFPEVGERVGKSDEAVRQIFNRSLKKLCGMVRPAKEHGEQDR